MAKEVGIPSSSRGYSAGYSHMHYLDETHI